jgi:SAM-dependent methyltransferase
MTTSLTGVSLLVGSAITHDWCMAPDTPYYRDDLALVHHLGFGFHADMCAPGILTLLEPVRQRGGVVLELGCGSGLLTRYLVDAGHRVIATDSSPAMLELTRRNVPDAEDIRVLTMPDDPLPACDAVVSIGHPVSYLPDEAAVLRALTNAADALNPGGVYAIDIEDVGYAEAHADEPPSGRLGEDWAIILTRERPEPNKFVRDMTTFLRNDDGTWRRDRERHENTLVDTSTLPALLAGHGVDVELRGGFGKETFPEGLVAIVGRRPRE